MHWEPNDVGGVSRLGGSGVGGGTAAGRHHAIRLSPRRHRTQQRAALECVGCGATVTGVAVIDEGKVFCAWECAVGVAGTVPGLYFG